MKNHRIKIFGKFVFGLATGIALTMFSQAQEAAAQENEIIIVNRDGEKVTASGIQIAQPKPAGAQDGEAKIEQDKGIKVRGSIQNKDGKWIVTDAEGNEREIDIQGAQSIILNQSVESVTENGENRTKRVGKAIIIGPDGKRHEIDLGGPMIGNGAQFDFSGFNGIVRAEQVNNSFMIGVHCAPVGDALRAQLQLDTETGLVVLNVSNDSPAQADEIEKHDILMFADDRQLGKQSDLVEAVQTAGKEKSEISLTIIRAGKEIGVDVSPVERPESPMIGGMPNIFRAFPDENGGGFKMQFRQMGPGLIMGENMDQDFHVQFEKQMKEVEARMESLRKQLEEQLNDGKLRQK